jgi:hypothetical protein
VVIGGGLTAIDTATESLAYYVVQVEKFLARFEALTAEIGEQAIRESWDDYEREIAEEFLAHARAIREEHALAAREKRSARVVELLRHWGGVTIAYRRRLIDSPSYTLNHEEVEKALEEGIWFAENLTPAGVDVDHYGAARGIRLRHTWMAPSTGFLRTLSRRRRYAAEHGASARAPGAVPPARKVLQRLRRKRCSGHAGIFFSEAGSSAGTLAREADSRFVSYFGDVHPSYFGNVVKAMGSAKQGYPLISTILGGRPPQQAVSRDHFFGDLADEFIATVDRVERLTPTIVEVVVRAPRAARQFHPGQFYRLQNFESLAPVAAGTRMQMEGLAMTGAWVDREQGLVSVIVLEMGGSSDLCAMLQPRRAGDPDGPDRHADRDQGRRNRRAVRRRTGQRGAVLDRRGVSRGRIESALFRRLQESTGPLPRRRHRDRRRRRRLVLRRGTGIPARPAAGPPLRRQYRPGDGRVRRRPARPACDSP